MGLVYVFPPSKLIFKTVNKIIQEQAKVILIVPDTKHAIWWPMIIAHMKEIMNLGKAVRPEGRQVVERQNYLAIRFDGWI